MKYIGIADKVLNKWLQDKEYISVADEGEAIAIAAGHWIQTGERATAFMSVDGFGNALNPLTSWVMPDGIEMNIVVSTGRQEPAHRVMTDIFPELIRSLISHYDYNADKISIEIINKE